VWVGVRQTIILFLSGIIGGLAFPANQKLDVRPVVLRSSTAVKDFP